VRFIRFWRQALATGGKLAGALGGLISVAVGGSAVAYWQAASHRAVWVIIGAAAVITLVMVAAYRMWDEADRRARDLQARFDQTPVAPDHAVQIRGLLTSAQMAVSNHRRCEDFGLQFGAVLRAHLPTLVAPLEEWDAATSRWEDSRAALREWVAREAPARGFGSPPWETAAIAAHISDWVDYWAIRKAYESAFTLSAFRAVADLPNGGWTAYLDTQHGQPKVREFAGQPDLEDDNGRLRQLFIDAHGGEHSAAITATFDALTQLQPPLFERINAQMGISYRLRPGDCPICALHVEVGAL
jgi:hypothetical protein